MIRPPDYAALFLLFDSIKQWCFRKDYGTVYMFISNAA